jgi:broad specificity phosphatase PhoE
LTGTACAREHRPPLLRFRRKSGTGAMTARLILVCHGSTDAVRNSAFPADEPLDDYGRAQARQRAAHLPAADRFLTSPELRTRQTAAALRFDASIEPALRDCDYGSWAGCSFEGVCARDPQAVSAWLHDPAATPHGGESILSLMGRVAEWLAGEATHHRRSIVVTHAGVIRVAIVHAIAAGPKSFWRIDIAPLSITRLSGTDGRWNLVSAGCTPDAT